MTKRSDQEIALGRRPARVSRIGQLAVAAEVPENPLDHGLLLDAGDHPQLPATTSASLYGNGEHPGCIALSVRLFQIRHYAHQRHGRFSADFIMNTRYSGRAKGRRRPEA